MGKYMLPEAVLARARAFGVEGEAWAAGLDDLVASLERDWQISVGASMSGGTHAFVAPAVGADGEKYVLKVDVPDMSVDDYMNEVRTLQLAGGEGFVRVFRVDSARRATLQERLGPRLAEMGWPVRRQIEILCAALLRTWKIPAGGVKLSDGADSVAWFRGFIPEAWESLGRPCPKRVIDRAMEYLDAREAKLDPARYVLVHGDVHNNNALQSLDDPAQFKLIDPDGIFYEPGYDLGVLMREWPEEYEAEPVRMGRERAALLSRLTGADEESILHWGYLQTVSTSLVLLQIGGTELAQKMLKTAEAWLEI